MFIVEYISEDILLVCLSFTCKIKNNKLKTSLANLFDLDLFFTNSEV